MKMLHQLQLHLFLLVSDFFGKENGTILFIERKPLQQGSYLFVSLIKIQPVEYNLIWGKIHINSPQTSTRDIIGIIVNLFWVSN